MRTVAIGDIHASADSLVEIVKCLNLTDEKLFWKAENTRLIFTGDLCDRGYESKLLYSLVMKWQQDAPAFGSEVLFIIGNHEVMAVWGLSHYTTGEEYAGYGNGNERTGKAEREKAFSPNGWIHSWLTGQHFILRRDRIVFSHGDVPTAFSDWSIDEIEDYTRESFLSVGSSGYTRYNLPDPLFSESASILWCREAEYMDHTEYMKSLKRFLEHNNSRLLVCGHTPSRTGRVRSKFAGRYLCIDSAMVFKPFGFGMNSAVIFDDDSAEVWYFKPGKILREPLTIP